VQLGLQLLLYALLCPAYRRDRPLLRLLLLLLLLRILLLRRRLLLLCW
jgi:hypothetical protein